MKIFLVLREERKEKGKRIKRKKENP